jgi:hypothetical protein
MLSSMPPGVYSTIIGYTSPVTSGIVGMLRCYVYAYGNYWLIDNVDRRFVSAEDSYSMVITSFRPI